MIRRRSRADGKPAKVRRRKTGPAKTRNTPKAAQLRKPSATGEETEVVRLTRELKEALEQQTATSEVLRVISSSPGDLQPVFEAMLENAVRICDAMGGGICRWDGNALRHVAVKWARPAIAELLMRTPIHPNPKTNFGRMLTTKTVVHVPDLSAQPAYTEQREPGIVTAVEVGHIRTALYVPMLKGGELIGAFTIGSEEVRPFTEKQIELVTTFADQAVIAIENARLLNELRQRTTDLTERTADLSEALEQQTATAEVLGVISSASGDLEPVFAAMLEKAIAICNAKFGSLFRFDGKTFRPAVQVGAPSALIEAQKRQGGPVPGSLLDRVMKTKQVQYTADAAADPFPGLAATYASAKSIVGVPILKDASLIGAILVYRQEVRPFGDKQIELLKNFAAQAVIAIENARLLNELRQRTDDLTEALEQQTATSEVLRVISGSPVDLQPVFEAMVDNAIRICDVMGASICRWDGNALHHVAMRWTNRANPAFTELVMRTPIHPNPNTNAGRMLVTRKEVHVSDLAAQPAYIEQREPGIVTSVEIGHIRTALYVPMLKESELVGAFILARDEVRPFAEKQIELVKNFAAQAVIAIENARLLTELRERTDQLEAQSQELADLNQQLEQRVGDQVGEIERMGRLRRFLPPQVADLIVASGSEKQLESHRREITALFCDLRGFTGFTESADAEDVMALLRGYHAVVGQKIIKYSGTLERYAGDGVMVVFNDPVPVDNPALQAVLMALEMRDVIGALTEKWHRLGHDIGFGIGIAHGYATLGTIGFEGRFDYAAIGTVSNVASRLCDEAKPGQILISPRVFMAVENAVTVEPVGEFALKGIRRPLAAYNVLATNSAN